MARSIFVDTLKMPKKRAQEVMTEVHAKMKQLKQTQEKKRHTLPNQRQLIAIKTFKQINENIHLLQKMSYTAVLK